MKTEEQIIRAALRALADAGYSLWVEDDEEPRDPIINSRPNIDKLTAEVMDLHEATVRAFKGGRSAGWVLFIPANEVDVLSDNTESLEDALAPVHEFIEQLAEEEA